MENDTSRTNGASEYDHFKDFTRAIIAVPKSDIDKAAKKLPPQKSGAKQIKKPVSK